MRFGSPSLTHPKLASSPRIRVSFSLMLNKTLPQTTGKSLSEKSPGPFSVFLVAACLGLITGLLEVAVLIGLWSYNSGWRLGPKAANRHYVWMIPVNNLLLFGICGLVLAGAAAVWPKAAHRVAAYVLVGLSALELLLLQSGLYKVTYLLMACGIASVAAPILVARTRNLRLSARRVLPGLVGVVAALALASHGPEVLSEYRASSRLREADPGSPNVLLIVLDTVRADGLSLHGYYRDTSPNLVRLASQGVRFDRAISAAPWTLASHATMFTGRWPHELGVGSYVALDHRYTTLAEVLGERGYVTGGFCANTTFGHAYYGLARGFIHYEDLPVSLYEVLRSGQISGRLLQKLDVLRLQAERALR